ncbi:AAA family ATPase [Candidatus Saccharibacteria bacterium]|jgi:hypothetical protein|nr:AAA family ATPase [Candidatus Saccharibacteria bacterium]
MKTHKAVLMFIRGIPGSGKTFIATETAKKIGNNEVLLIDPDTVDTESTEYLEACQRMRSEGVNETLFTYRFLREKARNGLLSRKVVIWNQAFTGIESFALVVDNFKQYAVENNIALKIYVTEVAIDPVIAKQRVRQRTANGGHGVDDDKFEEFIQKYRSLEGLGLGYDIISIDGSEDVLINSDILTQRITSSLS